MAAYCLAPCHHLHSCHLCQHTQMFSTNCQHTGMTNILHTKTLMNFFHKLLRIIYFQANNHLRHRKGSQGWMSSFITNYDELTPILNIYYDVLTTQVTQSGGKRRKECIICILIEKYSSYLQYNTRNYPSSTSCAKC